MTDDLRPVRDRTRLIAPELSDAEAATVARFDRAPDADEALRVKVAQAVMAQRFGVLASSHYLDLIDDGAWLDAADAAIAVMRGHQ